MAFDTEQSAFISFRSIIAERTSPLVIWTGAGMSMDAGLPTWKELKIRLVMCLRERLSREKGDESTRRRLESKISFIENDHNYWRSFELLKEELGAATYRDEIRRAINVSDSVSVPNAYKKIWELDTHGVINLNLDRLATRAYMESDVLSPPIEFNGEYVKNVFNVLNTSKKFIANLHGVIEDYDSWVFTNEDLDKLMGKEGYKKFIETCMLTTTVLFTGISVDDVAVGGHLERLEKFGLDGSKTHYWLTNRTDDETVKWAEKVGVRIIWYENLSGDHSEVEEFYNAIVGYLPKDEDSIEPIKPHLNDVGHEIPKPDEMMGLSANKIRKLLNSKASEILKENDEKSYEEYKRFCEDYDEVIHRAWYTSDIDGKNMLLDYKLEKHEKTGAFGRVYRATDSEGNQVAVKVLLEEIRSDNNQLKSFRRGVRSMRILSNHKLPGMVEFLDAAEIPAYAVMEWVDGPSLSEVVEARQLPDWLDVLRVSATLAKIIRDAHLLPERVLHRDLRPTNVMLRGFYTEPDDYEVVVLDFDLSWHKGAMEKSVLYNPTWGYLAPEQIENIPGVSTRNAAVDSFGFGMTMYYMLAERNPFQEEHRHSDWVENVNKVSSKRNCGMWRSLPSRVARLIIGSTMHEQSRRLDMGEIESELRKLISSLEDPASVSATDMYAEELACRTSLINEYEWDQDKLSAVETSMAGFEITIYGIPEKASVGLGIDWSRRGYENRSSMGKKIKNILKTLSEMLSSRGWSVFKSNEELGAFVFGATIDVAVLQDDFSAVVKGLDKVAGSLKIE